MQAKVQLEHRRLIEDRHLLEKKRTHKKKKTISDTFDKGKLAHIGALGSMSRQHNDKKIFSSPFPTGHFFSFFLKVYFSQINQSLDRHKH